MRLLRKPERESGKYFTNFNNIAWEKENEEYRECSLHQTFDADENKRDN